jgi:hypothetical protein
MSNAGHFNSKHAQEEKQAHVKRARFFEDFPVATRREADGSTIKVKGGKIIAKEPDGPTRESKHIAKADVSTVESKFWKPAPISTLLEKTTTGTGETSGNRETVGEQETAAHVRKRIDVHARRLKL